jgi:hypothetical protein
MTNFIPGGRGPRFGTDAEINRREVDELRRRQNPTYALRPFSSYHSPLAAPDPTIKTLTAGTFELSFLGGFDHVYNLRAARIHVNTARANSYVKTAIYRAYAEDVKAVAQVPGTEATFSSATTGIKKVTLQSDVTLQPGTYYYLGSLALGGNPTVAAARMLYMPYNLLHRQTGHSSLPKNINRDSMTASGSGLIGSVGVVYLPEKLALLV